MIDENKTFEMFGYRSTDLKPKSAKKIVAICDNPDCNTIRIIPKQQYRDLCGSCAQKKRFENPKEREKHCVSQQKRWEDPKEHEKTSKTSKKAHKDDPGIAQRHSESERKRYEDPLEREKASQRALTWIHDNPELQEKRNEARKKAKETPESRENAKVAANKRWEDPEEREKASILTKKAQTKDPTLINRMVGGNDLVNHHYIYDHNDLSLNTVKMTRSDHSKLHQLLIKLEYKVPHINEVI